MVLPGAPLAELQRLRDSTDGETVEVGESWAVPVDRGDVDQALADPVDLPVVVPALGVGTGPGASLGQLQGDLLEGLHQEVNVDAAV